MYTGWRPAGGTGNRRTDAGDDALARRRRLGGTTSAADPDQAAKRPRVYALGIATVAEILERLAAVDAERLQLIADLREMGFRSPGFVGEYGELLVAALYPESRRAAPSQPGYDLTIDGLGLVQVKTLRSTPTNHRTSMGAMRHPYEV